MERAAETTICASVLRDSSGLAGSSTRALLDPIWRAPRKMGPTSPMRVVGLETRAW